MKFTFAIKMFEMEIYLTLYSRYVPGPYPTLSWGKFSNILFISSSLQFSYDLRNIFVNFLLFEEVIFRVVFKI